MHSKGSELPIMVATIFLPSLIVEPLVLQFGDHWDGKTWQVFFDNYPPSFTNEAHQRKFRLTATLPSAASK